MTTASTLDIRIRAFTEGLEQMRTAQREVLNIGAAADTAAKGLSTLTGYVKAAAAAFLAFSTVQGIKALADYAARTETLGVTLDIVAGNAGYSKAAISEYERSLVKLGITTQAARESMTAMIQAGLPLGPQAEGSASNVAALARASQDLAVITGKNSSETFSRLITNIQQMDSQGLRFMGLNVNIVAAQEKWAAANGKVASGLTNTQKVLAVNNAVLAEAAKLTGSYEASMDTVGKKVQSLKRYQEELSDALGKKLLPAYGAIVDSATDLLRVMGTLAVATDKSGESAKSFGEAVASFSREVSDAVVSIARFASENVAMLESIGSNLVGVLTDVFSFVNALINAGTEAGVFAQALWTMGLFVAGLRDGLKLLEGIVLQVGGAVAIFVGTVLQGWGELAKAVGLDSIGDGLLATAKGFQGMGEASQSSARQIAKDFADGKTATQDFLNGVKTVKVSLADFGKATSFKAVTAEISNLTGAITNGSLSYADFQRAQKKTGDDMLALIRTGKLTATQIDQIIESARVAGVELPKGFSNSYESMKTLEKEAAELKRALSSIGKATTFSQLEAEFNTLIRAQQEGKISSYEAGKALDVMKLAVERFSKTPGVAAEEVNKLQQKISTINTKMGDDFLKLLSDLGMPLAEFATGVASKFQSVAANLASLASEAEATASLFTQAFSKGLDTAKTIQDVNALTIAFEDAKKRGDNLINSGNLEEGAKWLKAAADSAELAAQKFEQVFDASLKSTKTTKDFEILKVTVSKFAVSAGKDSEWVASRMDLINKAAARVSETIKDAELEAAFKKIGLSAEEASGVASKAIEDVVSGLEQLRASASSTAYQYQTSFSTALNLTKGIADLGELRKELGMARETGHLTWSEYQSDIAQVNIRFNELFEQRLKVAKTAEQFAILGADARKAFEDGTISGTQLALTLQEIQEKATGAKEEIARLSEQTTALAEEAVKVAQANTTAVKATSDAHAAKNELLKAEQAYAASGSLADKEKLKDAKDNLALAEAHAKVAKAQSDQAVAANEVLIAQQQLVNAEKAAELNAGNEIFAAAAAAAKDNLATKQQGLELAKQDVALQEKALANTETAIAAQKNLTGYAKEVSDWEAKLTKSSETFQKNQSEWNAILNNLAQVSFTGVANSLQGVGLSMQEATAKAGELMNGMQNIYAFGSQGITAYTKVTDGIANAKKALEAAQAEAENITTSFRETVEAASDVDKAGLENLRNLRTWNKAAYLVADAYRTIRKEAQDAAQSAIDSASGFANSVSSIKLELLKAQGNEAEAAAIEFDNRKKALAVEYELLKVKLMVAKATLAAANMSTNEVEIAIAQAGDSYREGLDSLQELERLDTEKREAKRKQDEADAKAQQEQDAAAANTSEHTPNPNDAPTDSWASGADENFDKFVGDTTGSASGGSYDTGSSSYSTGGAVTTSRIEVVLISGASQVVTYTDSTNETALLDLLNQAKAVA